MADQSTPVTLSAGQSTTGSGVLKGVTLLGVAAGVVTLFDNTSAAGVVLGVYALATGQTIDIDYNNWRHISKGIFVTITGTVTGSLFI